MDKKTTLADICSPNCIVIKFAAGFTVNQILLQMVDNNFINRRIVHMIHVIHYVYDTQ